jgi:hypothetical protein
MPEDRPDDQLPEHEGRRETDLGGGIAAEGGTGPETGADRRAVDRRYGYRPRISIASATRLTASRYAAVRM